jgi:hypothetical protein
LNGVLQILNEFLLLLDHLGRNAEDAGAHAPVSPRAVQPIKLFGSLFEALGERGDELVSIGQLGLERLDSILRHFCFDHPDATVARIVPVRGARFPSARGEPAAAEIFLGRAQRPDVGAPRLWKKGNRLAYLNNRKREAEPLANLRPGRLGGHVVRA